MLTQPGRLGEAVLREARSSTPHIRRLFLEPRATYSIADAANVLGMHWRDVRAWIESGELSKGEE